MAVAGYLVFAVQAVVSFGDFAAVANAAIYYLTIPLSLWFTIAQASWLSALALGLLVVLGVVLAVPMIWFIRIPLLGAVLAGLYYCAVMSGVYVS